MTSTPTPTPTATATPTGSISIQDLINQINSSSASTASSPNDLVVPTKTYGGAIDEQKAIFDSGGFSDARDSYDVSQGKAPGISTARTQSDVNLDILRMSDPDVTALANRMQQAGLLQSGWTRSDVNAAWQKLVTWAAEWHAANPKSNLTPEDMIDIYGNTGGDTSGKSTTQNYVTSRIQLSDPYTARALLTNSLRDALGRNPTGKEVDDFQSALNTAQQANPEVTTQTINTSPANIDPNGMGYKNTQTTVTGGLDTSGFTQQYLQNNVDNTAEYAHQQAATTYYQALLQGLAGPGGAR